MRLALVLGGLLAAVGLAGCPGGELPNPVAWVMVTTLLDVADGDTSGVEALRANPGPDGAVSLREALLAVNNSGPGFEIRFLPRGTVAPLTPLPALTAGGTLVEGDGKIVLHGNQRAGLGAGLTVASGGNRLRGLQISGFPGDGILLEGGSASDNVVQGCRIGNDGNNTARNGGSGIRIRGGGVGNVIGGTAASARNVISGNDGWGVALERHEGGSPRGTVVEGNYVGVALNGLRALPNRLGGVGIADSRENRIGGGAAGARNVLSGNLGPGVEITGSAQGSASTGNRIQGNLIGTSATGAQGPGNTVGVRLAGEVSGTQIGGNSGPEGNVIAGNRDAGVSIATGARNTIRSNSIFDNNGVGIRLVDAAANAGMPRPSVTSISRQLDGSYVVRGTAQAGASVELYIDAGREGGLFGGRYVADAQGRFAQGLNLAGFAGRGLNMTATATDRDGNTSEFSNPLEIR